VSTVGPVEAEDGTSNSMGIDREPNLRREGHRKGKTSGAQKRIKKESPIHWEELSQPDVCLS